MAAASSIVRPLTRALRLAALATLAAAAGCGSEPGGESSATGRVTSLVSELSDASGTPEGFQALFADGAAPAEADRPRYHKYMYVATSAKVSGESAEARVRVEDFNNTAIGEVTWTAVRQGDQWKLATAPLPH